MSYVERSVFLFSFTRSETTQFISLIIEPTDVCKKICKFIYENPERYLDIFILGPKLERFSFEILAELIDIDTDDDNIRQHEVKYPYWALIDSSVARFIFDSVLSLMKNEK